MVNHFVTDAVSILPGLPGVPDGHAVCTTPSLTLTVPGDKSMSHRAVIMASLATHSSVLTGFLDAADCVHTLLTFQQLGVPIQRDGTTLRVSGVGLYGLSAPTGPLYCGNSGTGIRLITGILAAQAFDSVITGDASIQSRPMARIMDPLSRMGALIEGRHTETDTYPPLSIKGNRILTGIRYALPVASAQVKSAVLLAALYANGPTWVGESRVTRDHTERLLQGFGVTVHRDDNGCEVIPGPLVNASPEVPIHIPGDFSSAAFFLAYGAVVAPVTIEKVGINPTRTRFLDVIRAMGADVRIESVAGHAMEPYATITVAPATLHNVEVPPEWVPNLIDEIPILSVLALFASGTLVIRQAAELRVKESDRIQSIASLIHQMGGVVTTMPDGLTVSAGKKVAAFESNSGGDHRMAMSGIMGALMANAKATIYGVTCINTSFPGFFDRVATLGCRITAANE